ncbi:preprotein translocase subunit SecG [Bartonella sp. B30(2025)]
MQTVLIVIHFLVVIALVGVILLQPSEGGGLSASNGSGLMKTRGTRNPLTRLTAILAFCFFAISIGLIVVGNISGPGSDIFNHIPTNSETVPLNNNSRPSILEQLGGKVIPEKQFTNPVEESPVPQLLEKPSDISNNGDTK